MRLEFANREQMDIVDDMLESHIDPKTIGLQKELEAVALQEIRVAFETKMIVFNFLPSQLTDFTKAAEQIPPDTNIIGLLPIEMLQKFKDAMTKVGEKCEIRSVGAVVSKMVDIALDWLEQQKKNEEAKEPEKTL